MNHAVVRGPYVTMYVCCVVTCTYHVAMCACYVVVQVCYAIMHMCLATMHMPLFCEIVVLSRSFLVK